MRPVLLQTSWVILTAAAIHGAAAQDVTGIRAGSFLFQPSASASVEFDSNFFLSETDPEQTVRTQLAPRLEIRSDWNRHAIKLSAGGARQPPSEMQLPEGVLDALRLAGQGR